MKMKIFDKQSSALLKGAALTVVAAMTLASCNDEPKVGGQEGQEENVGINVSVINDPSVLSQYVTNYKVPGNGSLRLSRADEKWSMPALPTSFDGMTKIERNPWWDGYNFDGNTKFYVAAGDELTFSQWSANSIVDIYIYGKVTVPDFKPAQGANIYVAPGGELTLTGTSWDGKPNSVLNDAKATSLYLYDGSTYNGGLDSQRGTSLWIEGDYTIANASFDGDNAGRSYVHIGGTLYVDNLTTSNMDLYADNVVADNWTMNNESHIWVEHDIDIANDVTINSQNVKVECANFHSGANFHMENNADFYAYEHMTVDKDMTVATQGTVYTPCLIVKETLYVTNCGKMNIPNYIYCDDFEASASGFTINMGGDALIYAVKTFTVSNLNWAINFDNNAETRSAIKTGKFQIMGGEAAYIWGYVTLDADEFWGKPEENTQYFLPDSEKVYNLQTTVVLGDVEITSDWDDCTPKFKTPTPDTPPTITELISSISHTHDISATCVALNGGKAYLSWHKRGTSIHGCLEALQVIDDQAQLTSWMEINDGDVEGDNNWDGNSAVGQTDETQGQYDFNHLIVSEGMVVTVGDHAKMGGFIGAVALDDAGDFGQTLAYDENKFKSRQLLSNVTEKVGRSGNTVAYNNGKYYIACARGFQEYNGAIADLFTPEYYKNGNFKSWKANLGDYELTAGSAKHIAFNPAGDKVATLELTAKGGSNDPDYWFNDTETAIGAVLKVRDANNWLGHREWEVNIGDICPVYGKNAIAMDAQGNVYVSAGKQGLLVYNNGALVDSFSIAAENPRAAVNGVAVDDQYVYVAYSVGGVYILNKSDLSVVSWYKSDAPEGYETEAPAASANYIAVDGEYIYVAYGRHGVKVLKLSK